MSHPPTQVPVTSRRRSQRIFVQVPIVVQGQNSNQVAFEEETETLVINAGGALILLTAKVSPGQKVLVKHKKTQEEQECHVVYLGPVQEGKTQVAIEFTDARAMFWRVSFPPDDWTPRHTDAKSRGPS